MPSVSTSATNTSSQVIRASAVTVSVYLNHHIFYSIVNQAHGPQVPVPDSVSASATNTLAPVHSGSGLFANANVVIAGGTFVRISPRLCH